MPIHAKPTIRRDLRSVGRLFRRLTNLKVSTVDESVLWAWMGVLAFGVLSFGAVEPWSVATFETGSGVLLLWWLLCGMHRHMLRVSIPPIFAPAVAFLGLIMLQIFGPFSANRFASQNSLMLFLSFGICVFVGAQVLDSEDNFRKFGMAASAFGLIISVLAIAQSLTSPGQIYWAIYPKMGDGVFGPYVNHSHYAGLMEMLIPFPFVLGFGRTVARGMRGFALVAATIMVGSVFMSASRGGIIAVAVQLCLVYFFLYKGTNEENRQTRRKGKRWTSVVAVLAALAAVLLLGGQEMVSRISTLKDPYGNTVGATRLLIAGDCLRMFAQHPLFGWGAGVFQEVYPSFRSFSTNLVINAAHNDYLQLLVEYGLAGAAIALCFVVIAYHRFAVLRLNWKDSWPHAVSFAALLGTVGILVHSLTDFNLQVPANATIFYVMCMVASLRPSEPVDSEPDQQPQS